MTQAQLDELKLILNRLSEWHRAVGVPSHYDAMITNAKERLDRVRAYYENFPERLDESEAPK